MRTFNISQTYVDENDPWTGIFAAAEFEICSTTNRQKVLVQANLYLALVLFSW